MRTLPILTALLFAPFGSLCAAEARTPAETAEAHKTRI